MPVHILRSLAVVLLLLVPVGAVDEALRMLAGGLWQYQGGPR
jgi:hypothetical protein